MANLSSNINRVERKEGQGGREEAKKEPQIQKYEETHPIWNSAIGYKNTLELEFQNELVFYFCFIDRLQLNNPREFSGPWLHLCTWVFWDQQYNPGVKSTGSFNLAFWVWNLEARKGRGERARENCHPIHLHVHICVCTHAHTQREICTNAFLRWHFQTPSVVWKNTV